MYNIIVGMYDGNKIRLNENYVNNVAMEHIVV